MVLLFKLGRVETTRFQPETSSRANIWLGFNNCRILSLTGDKDFWIYMRPLQISSRLLNKQYSSFSFHAQPGPQIRVILGGLTLRGQGVLNSSDQPGNWEELHCTGIVSYAPGTQPSVSYILQLVSTEFLSRLTAHCNISLLKLFLRVSFYSY